MLLVSVACNHLRSTLANVRAALLVPALPLGMLQQSHLPKPPQVTTLHFTCTLQSIASKSLYYLGCDRGEVCVRVHGSGEVRDRAVFVLALLGFLLV